jgi:hypothetical protein
MGLQKKTKWFGNILPKPDIHTQFFAQVENEAQWREILNILDWTYTSYCKGSSIAFVFKNLHMFKGFRASQTIFTYIYR